MATFRTLPQILGALSACQAEEAQVSNSLADLLSSREPVVAAISRLQSLVPDFEAIHVQASLLSQKVSATAQTADNVGTKVRNLDEEMRRIREAADRVGQVIELKVDLQLSLCFLVIQHVIGVAFLSTVCH